MASAGEDLAKLTVPQLKEKLKELSLPVSGNKAELIERLKSHAADKGEDAEAADEAKVDEGEAVEGEAVDGEAAEGDAVEVEEGAAEADETEEQPGKEADGDGEDVVMEGQANGNHAKDEEHAAEDGEPEESVKGEAKEEAKDEEMKEEPAEPEAPKEPQFVEEGDAAEDSRPRVAAGAVQIGGASDSTLNVVPTCGDKVLMSFGGSGFQHLTAATRCSVGVKAGRYLYEVRLVERRTMPEQGKHAPRQSCAIGFSTRESPLIFGGEGSESVAFDSEGYFAERGVWSQRRLFDRFAPYHKVYGVLLNLDPESPHCHTVSLFCDGKRMCKPQALPESMRGKVLYPAVNYKNTTLQVNFGPTSSAEMPFACRMLTDAAVADVEVRPARTSEKPEVVFPVSLPDEGTFEWLNGFLREHPQYTELSGRALVEWALKSGLYRGRSTLASCNDRPSMEFEARDFEDQMVQEKLQSIVPLLERDYVVMEVKNNLLVEERQKALERFSANEFKRVALVVMGEPPEEFKARTREHLLAEKRKAAAAAEGQRKKARKTEGEAKEEAKDDGESKKEDDGEKAEAPAEEEEKAEEEVELTEEEKKQWFPKLPVEDLHRKDFGRYFTNFSIPSKEEGFDEVRFLWQPASEASAYLQKWISERKLTQRVEDIQPGSNFREQLNEWERTLQEWRRRHNDRRDVIRRRTDAPELKRRKADEDKKDDKEESKADGAADAEDGEKADGEKADGEEKKEAEEKVVTLESVDPVLVEDILDIGNGQPLFADFTWEDWMMCGLRYEIHLLVHSFKADVNDEERPSFGESHLLFYYQRYFKKPLQLRNFGVNTNMELLEMVKDIIEVKPKTTLLDPQLSEDSPFENFVRLTEDARRERQRAFDAGDENAVLRLQRPSEQRGDNRGGDDRGGSRYRGGEQSRSQHGAHQSYHSGSRDVRGNQQQYRSSGGGGHSSRASSQPVAAGGYSGAARGGQTSYGSRSYGSSAAGGAGGDRRGAGSSGPSGRQEGGYSGSFGDSRGSRGVETRSSGRGGDARGSGGGYSGSQRDSGYVPRDARGGGGALPRRRSPPPRSSAPPPAASGGSSYGAQRSSYASQGSQPYSGHRSSGGGSSYGAGGSSRGGSGGYGGGGSYSRR